ncbi:PBP1A family penicillin-binding protein [Candidatus Microgenomates bacterium]|nr:MAG: PBP1A family penicillin-binding protein [Candidatus Microgenomates bacterium]
MKYLISIIVLFVVFLIKVGDFVLLIFDSFLEILKKISSTLLYILTTSVKLALRVPFKATKILVSSLLPLMRFKRPRFPSYPTKSFKTPLAYKQRKVKKITFFPLPLKIKLRYFLEGAFVSFTFIFVPIFIFFFLQNLPRPQELTLRQIPQTTKIYDRNGILLYQIYASYNRTIVPLSEIPKNLQLATIAIEDKDFYKHPGFNVLAITRSVIKNVSGTGFQGGSTITQQLIKSALLSPEITFNRKIKEVVLAFWAERIYKKDQILEMYFNQIPYGGTAWGAEAASEVYFGKSVKDLDLAESAFLAGIPKAPTLYSPYSDNDSLWKKRQKEVLGRMVDLGYITKDEAKSAEEKHLEFQPKESPIYAPHFVMYAKDFLIKKYGLAMVEKGGLNVITTLDLKMQDNVQKIVKDEVERNAYLNMTNGAALVTNPQNGDIIAMVGGSDYSNPNSGNVNLTTSLRQPGSSIKVVTYSAAFSKGMTAASILDDSPITFSGPPGSPPYSPVNYDGKFHGRVSLRTALANSFNIPAVKTLNQIGIPTFISVAKDMGIKSWRDTSRYGLSITLGGAEVTMLDMSTVFGTLANGGERVDLNPILKVSDYQGNTLEEKHVDTKRVLDEGIAYILSDILADNQARSWEFGNNSPLNIPNHFVSVKTGTSDDKRDNWTIGYTPANLVAVWVGNNDNSPMSPSLASGITGAAPIWNQIMTTLLQINPEQKRKMPDNVVQKDCLGRKEYFIKGTENSISCAPLPSFTPTPSK